MTSSREGVPEGAPSPIEQVPDEQGPQADPSLTPASSPSIPPPQSLQPAGLIRRAFAFLIDTVMIQCLYMIMMLISLIGAESPLNTFFNATQSTPRLFLWAWIALSVGYFTFFHAQGGQTPAKMVLRIQVVMKEGHPLSVFKAFCRTLGYVLSSLFLGAGFLLAIVQREKRCLHDLLARSYVIRI